MASGVKMRVLLQSLIVWLALFMPNAFAEDSLFADADPDDPRRIIVYDQPRLAVVASLLLITFKKVDAEEQYKYYKSNPSETDEIKIKYEDFTDTFRFENPNGINQPPTKVRYWKHHNNKKKSDATFFKLFGLSKSFVEREFAALSEQVAKLPPPAQRAISSQITSTDPTLNKLQTEVLQREREQAAAAARQAEEKRLRDRLDELSRTAQTEFKDDLPMLLGQSPVAKPNPRIHVLAIGINDYADVPDVSFADRSAKQFVGVAEKFLGAQNQNIILLTNAEATLGRLSGRLRTLLNRLGPQDQLLLYYAGHGVPGKDGKSAYLLAQDGGPGSYEEPALRLEQLYADIAKSRVGAAKLFIDACFSGRSGKDSIVFEGIAPILVTPKQSFPDSQRLAVMTAGRGDQFSNQNKDSGHRLFSYHLMRAMLETSPSLEIGSLHNRLRQRVLDDSRRIGPEFEQEPELQGNSKLPLLN
jgi:hypothetical protein